MFRSMPVAALVCVSVSVSAQEYDAQMHSAATSAAGQVAVMENMREDRGDATPRRDSHRVSDGAVAACRNKDRAAQKMGRTHPKVQRLYALCAKAGY